MISQKHCAQLDVPIYNLFESIIRSLRLSTINCNYAIIVVCNLRMTILSINTHRIRRWIWWNGIPWLEYMKDHVNTALVLIFADLRASTGINVFCLTIGWQSRVSDNTVKWSSFLMLHLCFHNRWRRITVWNLRLGFYRVYFHYFYSSIWFNGGVKMTDFPRFWHNIAWIISTGLLNDCE